MRTRARAASLALGLGALISVGSPVLGQAPSSGDRAVSPGKAKVSDPATAPSAHTGKASAGSVPVRDLKTRLDLKDPFNAAKGKVRIVAFLSPTCSHCIANVQQLQKLAFDRNDTPDLEMFAVWIKALEHDDKQAVARARTVLTDPRVKHYWDPQHVLNPQLLDAIAFDVQLRFYDVFLLYDRNAVWEQRLPRPGFWMHEAQGAPGPMFKAAGMAIEIDKALASQPLDTPSQ